MSVKCDVQQELTELFFPLAAHARLMYRQTVTIEDAVMAVSVMECSMQVCSKKNLLPIQHLMIC